MAKSKYVDASGRYDNPGLRAGRGRSRLVKSMATKEVRRDRRSRLPLRCRSGSRPDASGTVSRRPGPAGRADAGLRRHGDAMMRAGGRRLRGRGRRSRTSAGAEEGLHGLRVRRPPTSWARSGRRWAVCSSRVISCPIPTGTVTTDSRKAVSEFKGSKVEYRTDRNGNDARPVGQGELPVKGLLRNYGAVLGERSGSAACVGQGRATSLRCERRRDGSGREDRARLASKQGCRSRRRRSVRGRSDGHGIRAADGSGCPSQ